MFWSVQQKTGVNTQNDNKLQKTNNKKIHYDIQQPKTNAFYDPNL